MSLHLSSTPGPKPFAAIHSSPHRAEIDERLFSKHQPVLEVHRWLTEDIGVEDVSYSALNRYRHATLGAPKKLPDDVRDREVKKDLRYLSAVIKAGRSLLSAGLAPRPTEVIKAIELRAHLLAAFPDVSAQLREEYEHELRRFSEAVLGVVTNEERLAILARLSVSLEAGAA